MSVSRSVRELEGMPQFVQEVLDNQQQVLDLAKQFAYEPSVLFLARRVGFPIALKCALKLKDLAYIHAEGFAAGEFKHGPIAVIDTDLPVFVVVPPKGRDMLHDKAVSNIQGIRARGARTIVLAEEDDQEVAPYADVLIRLPKVQTLLRHDGVITFAMNRQESVRRPQPGFRRQAAGVQPTVRTNARVNAASDR